MKNDHMTHWISHPRGSIWPLTQSGITLILIGTKVGRFTLGLCQYYDLMKLNMISRRTYPMLKLSTRQYIANFQSILVTLN